MAERAAITEATYCDLRFVKGRKQCQIILEIPQERAQAFVDAFGTPNPANPQWVALARLASPTQRTASQWEAMTPKAQMLARANEPEFQKFMRRSNAHDTLKELHKIFSIRSRFPLSEEQEKNWKSTDAEYQASQ